MTKIDAAFVKSVETNYFRTNEDVGVNLNALLIWNVVRKHLGLPRLDTNDLPAYCLTHKRYHVLSEDYGCVRKKELTIK